MESENSSELKSNIWFGFLCGSIVFAIELWILTRFDVPQSLKGSLIFIISIIAIGAGVGVLWIMQSDVVARKQGTQEFLDFAEREKNFMVNENLIIYKNAIASGNKSEALRCGRLYYASMRDDNILTIYDEQALNNDISAMK